jgi:hypothetical protein
MEGDTLRLAHSLLAFRCGQGSSVRRWVSFSAVITHGSQPCRASELATLRIAEVRIVGRRTTEQCLDLPNSSANGIQSGSRYHFIFATTYRRHLKSFAANLPVDVGSADSHAVAIRLAPRLAFASLSGRSVCGSKGAATRVIVPDLHGSGAYCFAFRGYRDIWRGRLFLTIIRQRLPFQS